MKKSAGIETRLLNIAKSRGVEPSQVNAELSRKVTCKNSLNEGRRRIVIFSVKICHRMIFNFFVPVSCRAAELAEQSRALQRMSLITVDGGRWSLAQVCSLKCHPSSSSSSSSREGTVV